MADDATLTITLNRELAAQLSKLAAEEGFSPEELAASAVADMVHGLQWPRALMVSDDELAASVETQRREIAEGRAAFHTHEDVMAAAQLVLDKARGAKS